MRGITPVIAIILLLLMAVAAAGGFYFVYQGFTEEGEESGSTQIESLGEQSLAAIQIESAAGGRIYVKNVGASDIDLSKARVYVENVPYNVNTSSDTLAERSRAVLKFTERPSCASDECEVKISGAASTSKKVDLAKLLCSSDADCLSGEACQGGVCFEGGGTSCGDGTCDEGETSSSCPADCYCGNDQCDSDEDGETCFPDCGPRSLFFTVLEDQVTLDSDVVVHDWNGTTYLRGENLTNDTITYSAFGAEYWDGTSLSLGITGSIMDSSSMEVFWSQNDGSGWSVPDNITENSWFDMYLLDNVGFNSTHAIAVWAAGSDFENVSWSSFDGTEWSEAENITGVRNTDDLPTFEFHPDGKGIALWPDKISTSAWLNYSVWDGGWLPPDDTLVGFEGGGCEYEIEDIKVASNSTHLMAVWDVLYGECGLDPYRITQWATWDGSGWSSVENVSDEFSDLRPFALGADDGGWVLVSNNGTSPQYWPEWFSWQDGWIYEGNITGDPEGFPVYIVENENGAKLLLMFDLINDYESIARFSHWTGETWSGVTEIPEPVFFLG